MDGFEFIMLVDGVFIYVGFVLFMKVFLNLGIIDDEGYIVMDEEMCINFFGIFVVGDVCVKSLC